MGVQAHPLTCPFGMPAWHALYYVQVRCSSKRGGAELYHWTPPLCTPGNRFCAVPLVERPPK